MTIRVGAVIIGFRPPARVAAACRSPTWFDFDNYAGTYRATRHLISQGHRHIALLENNSGVYHSAA